MPVKVFTKSELARYDGKGGRPAYIAYMGLVYDVTGSWQWTKGKHQVVHAAGNDLTDELKQAPHGADLLDKFAIVGSLAGE